MGTISTIKKIFLTVAFAFLFCMEAKSESAATPFPDFVRVSIPDNIATDTIPEQYSSRPEWKKLLLKGKLDLKDPYIQYPKFVKFCVDVYNWGDSFFNTYDTTYVVGVGKRWKAMLKNSNWADSYAMHFNHRIPVRMLSDVYCDVGAYLSYMAVTVGYSVNVANLIDKKKNSRRRFEFQFSCSLFSADVYYWENTGGTRLRQLGKYNDGKFINEEFPGLQLKSYGLDFYYFVNHKRYSQAAAYNYSRYQKKSAGSFIAGITMSHQDIDLDFSSLPPEMLKYLQSSQLTYKFNYNDFCLMFGYAYNAVMGKHWLFNITATPSIGFMHSFQDSVDGKRELFSMNILGKMAFVYNHRNLFCSFNAKIDGHWYMNRNYSFFNSMEHADFTVGVRF